MKKILKIIWFLGIRLIEYRIILLVIDSIGFLENFKNQDRITIISEFNKFPNIIRYMVILTAIEIVYKVTKGLYKIIIEDDTEIKEVYE